MFGLEVALDVLEERLIQGVYIDLGKTDLTSDKIKLYVRKNLTAASCDMVGHFMRERLIHVLFQMMADVRSGVSLLIIT